MQPWPAEQVRLGRGVVVAVRRAPARDGDSDASRSAAGPDGTGGGAVGRPSALLVHGLGGASTNYTDLMHLLDDDADLAALDLPGFGLSPAAPSGDHGIPAHVAAVVALLERSAARPVHLVGNSMGGLVSTLVAAQRPDLVRSLLLVAPALPTWQVAPAGRLLTLLALPRMGERLMARTAAQDPEAQVRAVIRDIFGNPEAVPPGWLEEAVEERRIRVAEAPWGSDVFLDSLRSMIRLFLPPGRLWRDVVARIQAPTTVVYGGRDRLVHAAARRWHTTLPRAEVVVLPTMGHVAQIERPDLVAALARDLWQRTGQPATQSG